MTQAEILQRLASDVNPVLGPRFGGWLHADVGGAGDVYIFVEVGMNHRELEVYFGRDQSFEPNLCGYFFLN